MQRTVNVDAMAAAVYTVVLVCVSFMTSLRIALVAAAMALLAGPAGAVETEDVVWASRGLAAVSVREGGRRTIRLPRDRPEGTRVRDLYTSHAVGAGTQFQADFQPRATRVFRLENRSKTHAGQAPPTSDPIGPMWDMEALSRPPRTFPADGFQEPGMRALFFEGPAYRGKPTRVFAWIGTPRVEPGKKVPGMVLIHGGGGTAFASWVRLWNERGYAAIAMDTCGCVPKGVYGNWERSGFGGPAGWGGWDQIDEPRGDQWTYHAVADAILAHSLLRAQPGVDAGRIGLTGISWGGYLTCIVAGVDPRVRFAVPVYGCGFTSENGFAGNVLGLGPERAARWMRWWDPSVYLKDVRMPMLWVTRSNDFAYTFNALQKSYRLPRTPRTLAIRLRMPHGHGPAGEAPKEIWVYADSFLKGGQPLPRIVDQGRSGTAVWATFHSSCPVVRAELNVTRDSGKWQDRRWDAIPATIAGDRVTATLPEGVTVYYINLFDDRDCVTSTEHVEIAHP